MQSIRGRDISMIFQEPMTSLNPVFTVGAQIMEAILLHQRVTKAEARERTIALLDEVGIPNAAQRVDSYPHQMSGGQKQRVMIAMALSCNPQLLIADEPTTALDVTIQAQILDILRKLRDERGMAIVFITHDLGVIAEIADDVLVMYRGKEVEYGPVLEIFSRPQASVHEGPARLPAAARIDRSAGCRRSTISWRRVPSDGEVRVVEKKMDPARLKQLAEQGRGRLLHPKSELAAMGHPWEESQAQPRYEGCRRGDRAALARRESAGLLSRSSRHPRPRGRPCEGGRRHQLQRLPRPDARPRWRERLRQDDRRPGHLATHRTDGRPRYLQRHRHRRARQPRAARLRGRICRSCSRTRTARSIRG